MAPTERGPYRGSSRSRGYTSKWDRLAIAFRRKHPFCRFCEQDGRDDLAECVDHIIPAAQREDLRYEWSNLQALCARHHDGLKQRMEILALGRGDLEALVTWCSSAAARPLELKGLVGGR